ncbi:16S rRNA (cytidine(1402)-2'-O)-methyltransferase [Nisaea acidiphila]|uniref:Ribosomal RNA small subunit methyltransferase I n=1 Tax=Nisaea acidiphila TaxID=1862145 RepID=A0A9J7AWH7_9PROT|nr:16S rRNA (cytidine(1402)-2'-O)-methyltransferase [Nisaea acidiphila]UUX52163.1 16S rRNA (cytidine(1402)-2'-O)-methyltransferase [Nisaea acidiphila]
MTSVPVEMAQEPEKIHIDGLVLVATPIGNLGDISRRALETLAAADIVACEDTRLTGRLLQRFAIRTRLLAYQDHNAEKSRPELLRMLAEGKSIALVTDAGTPTISDPGYKLVREAAAQGTPVTSVPGPAAPVVALSISGLPTDRFFFGGFLPTKKGERRRVLEEVARLRATLIFFEAPRRLAESLADAAEILGSRDMAVARELTKRFEDVTRGRTDMLARHYAETEPPKGEAVLLFGPPEAEERPSAETLDGMLSDALGRVSLKDAAKEIAAKTGVPRKEIYERALRLKEPG